MIAYDRITQESNFLTVKPHVDFSI
jgi:hypothetical protein